MAPNPDKAFPNPDIPSLCYIKNVIKNPNIVAGDIPPYSVAVGNPCRVVKKRFDDETIERLLKLKWWDWDIEKITQNIDKLYSGDF